MTRIHYVTCRGAARWQIVVVLLVACLAAIVVIVKYSRHKEDADRAPQVSPNADGAVKPSTVTQQSPGEQLFVRNCAPCHGATGEGNGPAAKYLYPRPRDFSENLFRIVSTENGRPSDRDLFGVITRGMPGSAMIPFGHLSEADRKSLVAYVRDLTKTSLIARVKRQSGEEVDLTEVDNVLKPGPDLEVPSQFIPTSPESVAQGRAAYVKVCASCHGDQGKGDGVQDQKNSDGMPTRPRDLTRGIFKGGREPASEYNCPATKSNYWIGVRPGLSDTAVFLGITKILMDEGWYDAAFVRRFTDFPLLVRTDTLKRLRPEEVIKGYKPKDLSGGPSYRIQGLTDAQRAKIGDFTIWDAKAGRVVAVSRDEVGIRMPVEAALTGSYTVALLDGTKVEVMPIFEMYKRHLRDYDLKTVEEISGAAPALVRRLAEDIWNTTRAGHPVSIHIGEGINHYFHATLHNRATHLPLMLTGNIGKHGAGVYTWAGNYKGALLQASSWSGPGVGVYTHEDPFHPVLDEKARITHEHLRHLSDAEDPSYWACGEKLLALNTPRGRKVFTGKTHMPTPTKAFWYNNANFLNQAKWIYNIIVNVLPKVDLIVDQQIEWTGSAEYSDVVLPVNSWLEFQDYEAGASCSNPFLQVWKGGIKPVHDSRDDAEVFAGVARALATQTKDRRFADYFKFVTDKKAKVYLQRVFDSSSTTRARDRSYQVDDLVAGKYGGEPGAALLLFRTYPRVPFWEQVHDSIPFYTDSGRLSGYCDLPEAIEYGENLVVHREGVEATPYMPNVIVSTSPFIRPANYNIPLDTLDADLRQLRNVKLPWAEAKKTANPLWQRGFHFFCSTPKSRHSTHSSWSTVDWHWIWSDNFGDPYRADKRAPGVADRQIQMNPQAAKDLGINEGDYVYVDANPEDRPYVGFNAPADKGSFRQKAFRCLVRVKFNPGLPYNFTIMKHTGWIATERSVRAHETRPDGRALAADTGYQASYRYGSHQSITRGWMPPMHQTDTLFHKRTGAMAFVFGADVDNHAINTVPKETLIRITKAEDGGIGGKGPWLAGTQGCGPGNQQIAENQKYLTGGYIQVQRNA
jgi:nitrate reductase alpha subunit